MTNESSALSCPACAAVVASTHPYSWCSACGATLPDDVTAHLDNAHTKPAPPLAIMFREDGGPGIDEVHQAVEALLEPPSVNKAALVLTGTMLLFAGALALRGSSVAGIAILVGTLFFHESGHYLAMRAFGYKNVRMFFIPFLGAAVSSPSSGIAAWKEGIVLLAGPVPGVVVGVFLLLAGIGTGTPWMFDAARVALALNFFNMLPLGPLDGGQLFRLTLFGRGRWLEMGFLVVTCVALAAFAIWSQAWLLAFFAIAVAATARHRYRQRAVAERLRADHPAMPRDLAALTPEHQRVLYAYAVDALPATATKTAEHVAQAMRTLLTDLTPPPSWLASVALLFVWAVVGVVAFFGVGATALPDVQWADRQCPNMAVTAHFPSEPAASVGALETPVGQRALLVCTASALDTGSYSVLRVNLERVPDRAMREAIWPVLGSNDAVDQMVDGRYTARVEKPADRVWMRFIFDGPIAYHIVAEGGEQLPARRFLQSIRLDGPAADAGGGRTPAPRVP